MRFISLFLVALAVASSPVRSATPPAAQLLPADTLALFSVPDWDNAAVYWKESPNTRLWQDPAMRPFKDKLLEKWRTDVVGPLERELGIKMADYVDLLHGQVTFALTQNGWGSAPGAKLGMILLVDSKNKEDALKTRLADLKRKWVDSGKNLKSQRIRDVDFTTIMLTGADLRKALDKIFPAPKQDMPDDELDAKPEDAKAAKTELTFGQSGSLLIVGNNLQAIETVLARQSGGLTPALADQAAYAGSHGALFREALALSWLNVSPLFEVFQKTLADAAKSARRNNPLAPRQDKILAATGLGGVKTIAAAARGEREGTSTEVFVNAPESARTGLLKLLLPERKEAGPPPFVGADVMKFSRWRLDGQKAWAGIENLLTSISPEFAGLLQMALQAAGKDRNPEFDLKKALVGNLGDDFITVQKPPRSSKLGDLNTPPSLFLIGSANAEQFVQGLKAGTALMPLAAGAEAPVKEREFLGRKIYSLTFPAMPGADPDTPAVSPRSLNFAAAAGYAAISTDVGVLEEYLRTTESIGKSLRETPGLADAAQKVGGTSTGFFGYQNQSEAIRVWIESAKGESAALDKLLSLAGSGEKKDLKSWFDVSLLPPFERIAKYFSFMVYSLNTSDAGLNWKFFAPVPPQLQR